MSRLRRIDGAGVTLVVAGFVAIVAGWVGVHNQRSVVEQLPYLVSGGIGGLGLIGAGALALHVSRQQRVERMVTQLASRQEELESALNRFVDVLSQRVDLQAPVTAANNRRLRRPRTTDDVALLRAPRREESGS